MPLEPTLRLIWRNFWTLFLVVAVVTVPLHVVHAFAYRRVVEVRDLHDNIDSFPVTRQVRSVGRDALEDYRRALTGITILELVLVPLLVGAARRVAQVDAEGRLPTVIDAWTHALGSWRRPSPIPGSPFSLAVGLLLAVLVGWLVGALGTVLSEPVPDVLAFGPVGLGRGLARAAGGVFALMPPALLGPHAATKVSHENPGNNRSDMSESS